jgi:hypothetical protein
MFNDFAAEFALDNIKLYRRNCGIVLNEKFDFADFRKHIDEVCYDTSKQSIVIAGANLPAADIKNIFFSLGFSDAVFVQPVFALASYFGYDFGRGCDKDYAPDIVDNGNFRRQIPIMVVAICENTTDVAIIEDTKVIYGGQINIGIRTILNEISAQFDVSDDEASRLFNEIGSLMMHDIRYVKYPDYTVTAENIRTVIYPFYEQILGAINHILSEANINTIRSVKDTGIFIGGAGANICGMKDAVYAVLGINALIAKDADNAIIYGTGELLNNIKLLLTLTENT